MANGLSNTQLISVIVNLCVLVVSLIASGVLIFKIKFDDNNYRLLFVLYTIYWVAPMLLREYTSQMHLAMSNLNSSLSSLMWLPITVYGIIGLFWKPLNDLLSHRLKSRKTVIYISFGIQLVGAIPMLVYPCLATNIIQSVTVGIGASGIAVFNLMFNEQYAQKKVFVTVSLLSLPPLIAEFLSSVLQACVTSFLPGNIKDATGRSISVIEYDPQKYIDIVKWMWIIGIAFIVIGAILGIFVKEKKNMLYQDNQYKEPVENKWDGAVITLLIIAAAVTSFIKFCTAGGTAITELSYIGKMKHGIETGPFEGYLSVIFTVGQMVANIVTGLVLVKKFNKWALFSAASILWVVYAVLSAAVLNVYARLPLMILNGFAFGMTYNLIVGIVMNKFFTKTTKITPITLYNVGLSIGIVSSQFFNTFMKQEVFAGKSLGWDEFIFRNWIVTFAVIGTIALMWGMFTGAYWIEKKHPPRKIKVDKVKNWQDMDD